MDRSARQEMAKASLVIGEEEDMVGIRVDQRRHVDVPPLGEELAFRPLLEILRARNGSRETWRTAIGKCSGPATPPCQTCRLTSSQSTGRRSGRDSRSWPQPPP